MLKRYGVRWYASKNMEIKAAIVERWNRTLKEKMYRYFTYKNTLRYLDVLPRLIDSYNNSYHRSIGMRPIEVNSSNASEVAARLYPKKPDKIRYKYKIGQHVKVSESRLIFKKGYLGSWSSEVFVITAAYPTQPVTYQLSDLRDTVIDGRFYEPEIQAVKKPDLFAIDKVIKTRKRGNKTQYYVSFRDYGPEFNEWVDSLEPI